MKKIFNLILIALLVITSCACSSNKDAKKFKTEYESLNNTSNSNMLQHRNVTIPKNNPLIYSTGEEIVKKIENKETFYVYFGSSYCPWCRSVIEKMVEVAKKNKIAKIYYVDIWDGDHVEVFRDIYELDEESNPKLIQEGTAAYYKILEYLANVLDDYTLTTNDKEVVNVKEKRIFAPNFIYVEKGEAKKIASGISALQTNSRMELNDDILKEEEKIFNDFFNN